jgi:hypothetical protein
MSVTYIYEWNCVVCGDYGREVRHEAATHITHVCHGR